MQLVFFVVVVVWLKIYKYHIHVTLSAFIVYVLKQSKHVVLDNKYFIKKNLYIWYRLPSRSTEVKILQVDVTTSESRIEVDSLTRMYDFPFVSTA